MNEATETLTEHTNTPIPSSVRAKLPQQDADIALSHYPKRELMGPFDPKLNRQLVEAIFDVSYSTLANWANDGLIKPQKEKLGGIEMLYYTVDDIAAVHKKKSPPKKDKCITVAVWSMKGGVGKSFLTRALSTVASTICGGSQSPSGRPGGAMRTLVIDFDPQADTTAQLGLAKQYTSADVASESDQEDPTIVDLMDWTLTSGEPPPYTRLKFEDVVKRASPSLHAIPSTLDLAEVNYTLAAVRDKLPPKVDSITKAEIPGIVDLVTSTIEPLKEFYDVIIFDLPPSVELLAVNALRAADVILMPVELSATALRTVRRNEVFLKKLMDLSDGTLFAWERIILVPNKFQRNNLKLRVLAKMQELWSDNEPGSFFSLSGAVIPLATIIEKCTEARTPEFIAATRYGKSNKHDVLPAREIVNQLYLICAEILDLQISKLLFEDASESN
jgi:cellulose biosynthesis protein BcsQ